MTEVKAVVVTDTCPYCEMFKSKLAREGLLEKVQIINASTEEGLAFAQKHGIREVPECVVVTENGQVKICSEQEFKQLLKDEHDV